MPADPATESIMRNPHLDTVDVRRPLRTMLPEDVVETAPIMRVELSPAGTTAAIVRGWAKLNGRRKTQPELRVFDRGTDRWRVLESIPGSITGMKWSSVGEKLAVLSSDAAQAGVWLSNADGERLAVRHAAPDLMQGIDWSPEADEIVVAAKRPRHQPFLAFFRVSDGGVEEVCAPVGIRRLIGEPVWSPSGKYVAITVELMEKLGTAPARGLWLYDRSTRAHRIQTLGFSEAGAASWSPDSAWLALIAPSEPVRLTEFVSLPDVSKGFRLVLVDPISGVRVDAAHTAHHVIPGRPGWLSPGTVVVQVGNGVFLDLYRYDLVARTFRRLTHNRNVSAFAVNASGAIAYASSASATPARVFLRIPDGTGETEMRLPGTDERAGQFHFGCTEIIRWPSRDGLMIEGLLLRPTTPTARPSPLLTVVHGGPRDAHFANFKGATQDAGEFWAARGWAVFYPNPRGSMNYGDEFMGAIIGDWGGVDLHDIEDGIDQLIRAGVADPERLVISGWSFGGYTAAWAVTQTNRFKAAIVGAGISNIVSMYGTTDLPGSIAAYFKGIPSEDALELSIRRSPLYHARSVETPVLIIHGALDTRTPVGQAKELYRALCENGRKAELAIYQDEGHGFCYFDNMVDRIKRSYVWATRHTSSACR